VPAAKKDEGIKVCSWDCIWVRYLVHLLDVKVWRQHDPKGPPEGGSKRAMKDQMQRCFRLLAAHIACVVLHNLPSKEGVFALDSAINQQPSKELDTGWRIAIPEVTDHAFISDAHRLDQGIEVCSVQFSIRIRKRRAPFVCPLHQHHLREEAG